MQKLIFALVMVLEASGVAWGAEQNIFSCTGKDTYSSTEGMKVDLPYKFKIYYDDSEKILSISDENFKNIESLNTYIYSGYIETLRYSNDSFKKKLIVTKKNHKKSGMSLTGISIDDHGNIITVRIDAWEKGMPFILLEVFEGKLITGFCE